MATNGDRKLAIDTGSMSRKPASVALAEHGRGRRRVLILAAGHPLRVGDLDVPTLLLLVAVACKSARGRVRTSHSRPEGAAPGARSGRPPRPNEGQPAPVVG